MKTTNLIPTLTYTPWLFVSLQSLVNNATRSSHDKWWSSSGISTRSDWVLICTLVTQRQRYKKLILTTPCQSSWHNLAHCHCEDSDSDKRIEAIWKVFLYSFEKFKMCSYPFFMLDILSNVKFFLWCGCCSVQVNISLVAILKTVFRSNLKIRFNYEGDHSQVIDRFSHILSSTLLINKFS